MRAGKEELREQPSSCSPYLNYARRDSNARPAV